MGFFDKVTRAVGDAVDKGKKDIDQFMRIQKINGEIGSLEKKVAELEAQIQQATQSAGARAIELVKTGALSSPDLQAFVERIASIEQQIAAEQAAIAGKKADIERIKAEEPAPAVQAPPAAEPAAPPPAPAPAVAAPAVPPPAPAPAVAAPAVPPPLPVPPAPQAARVCAQCGKPLAGGSFCTECGARVG